MALKDDLITARSYIVFIAGLLVAFITVYTVEKNAKPPQVITKVMCAADGKPVQVPLVTKDAKGAVIPVTPTVAATPVVVAPAPVVAAAPEKQVIVEVKKVDSASIDYSKDAPIAVKPRALTPQELEWAKIAWRYFQNNTSPDTGLANSVDSYPASTMWDTASYLMAMISAERIGVIKRPEFDQRMTKVLKSLEKIALFDKRLPNKSYNTNTLAMVNYANKDAPDGIGWSAIDVGRILVPLHILTWQYPKHMPTVKRIIAKWHLADATRDGEMIGAKREEGSIKYFQEGRLGYEQYAAKTFSLLGQDVMTALNYRQHLQYIEIYGIRVPFDDRQPEKFGGQNFVLSEPYVLDGLEFGFDNSSREFAWRVFRAQQARYLDKKILTAVTEDHVDGPPYFVYNTVYNAGKTWVAVTENGKEVNDFRALSVKAAFGWHALYNNDYTKQLIATVSLLNDPEKGFYTSQYEKNKQTNKAINANTNGIILESLAYIKVGKLMPF